MKRICLFFLLLLCTVGAMGQKRSITGVVVDMTGEPIIGASIVEIGTTNGTVTDIVGKFSLSVPTNGKIQISYVGYKPETLTIKNQTVLQIKMAEDSEMLGEVVVTGYGGTQLRSKLTNSISKVKEEHLAVGLFSNPAQALSGSVAGLKVTQSTGNPAHLLLSYFVVALIWTEQVHL